MMSMMCLSLALLGSPFAQDAQPLATGKALTPAGVHQNVGSWPCRIVRSPDGRFMATTNVGRRQFVSILDASTGQVLSQTPFEGTREDNGARDGLYLGLEFMSGPDGNWLLVSHGVADVVTLHSVDGAGELSEALITFDNAAPEGLGGANHTAGVAVVPELELAFAVNNHSYVSTALQGSVTAFSASAGPAPIASYAVPAFPLDIATTPYGLIVSCERDGVIVRLDPATGETTGRLRTGQNAGYLTLGESGKLYVSNANSDTVSVVDPESMTLLSTILVRPDAARGLPGATPLGMSESPDGETLYVAMADLNAVAVVNLDDGSLRGYVPTGWYPTDVVATDSDLFVTCAKGVETRWPNGVPGPFAGDSTYVLDQYEGVVSRIAVPAGEELALFSEQVLENNRFGEISLDVDPDYNPGIEHVIYVIKENRTYDQILGDLPQGNGDPELCLFPREVTPNQHALAERFVLLDNFYVCAEVSADGWNWSTGGHANAYTQRNMVSSYSGRRRPYDYEGQNFGVAVDREGVENVARPSGGYIWENCFEHGVSFRNYGVQVASTESGSDPYMNILVGRTSAAFSPYDMNYMDSPAWLEYGVQARNHLTAYGPMDDPSRITAFLREFDEMVADESVPQFMLLRLPTDHAAGTRVGSFSPSAMVADNDYAVGLLVEAVSNSPIWEKTAIFIVEDDAQAGIDHVDSHRSTAYVISPFVERSTLDSSFYNTDSVLRSMQTLLSMRPMNHFDATAPLMRVFGTSASNSEPFVAIRPPKEIVTEVNAPDAYRAADSERLVNRFQEESLPDVEMNDILWHAIKGEDVPIPRLKRNVIITEEDDD